MATLRTVLITLVIVFLALTADRVFLHWYSPRSVPVEEVADSVAAHILGDWERSTPQVARSSDNYKALREAIQQPGFGASAQMRVALVRLANVAALPQIQSNLLFANTANQRLERLHQCVEFVLGISGATLACNLVPIAP